MHAAVKLSAHIFFRAAAQILLVALATALAPQAQAVVADPAIKNILTERIDVAKKGVGLVVGVIDADGSRVISQGVAGNPGSTVNGKPVNGDTVFEIGSISKVFTSLLLADMVTRGEVSLDDPISKYLPATVKAPERNGKVITLRLLATHRSGLPRMPANFEPRDPANPYADYSAERMLAFLNTVTLARDPGEGYEYSNYGAGLLGYLLARRAGLSYAALLRTRILQPLEMNDTAIVLYPVLQARFAQGHDAAGKPLPAWDFDALAGAGGIRSTVNDMLKFLAAQMGKKPTSLQAAMALSQQALFEAGGPNQQIGLGWHIASRYGTRIVWHNGATAGFHSYMGFTDKEGVVVLANSQNNVDDIGYHLLEARYPLSNSGKTRTAITLAPAVLDAYVGQYQLAPEFIITFSREGDKFFAQATRQPRFEVFAESETEFFLKAVDAQISFVKNAYGKVDRMVLHQGGRDQEGPRLSAPAAPTLSPAEMAAARRALAPAQLAKFADQLEQRGYGAARRIHDDFSLNPGYKLPEGAVNSWGMALLPGFPKDGLELLKLNADLNPRSAYAFNSLGYAYRITGENVAALKNYQRALELDPGLAATSRAIAFLQRKPIKLDPKAFDVYAGGYEILPGYIFTIRRDGDRYYSQLNGGSPQEIFAESDGVFFDTTELAQITFFKDAGGKVTHFMLNEKGGRDSKAVKLY